MRSRRRSRARGDKIATASISVVSSQPIARGERTTGTSVDRRALHARTCQAFLVGTGRFLDEISTSTPLPAYSRISTRHAATWPACRRASRDPCACSASPCALAIGTSSSNRRLAGVAATWPACRTGQASTLDPARRGAMSPPERPCACRTYAFGVWRQTRASVQPALSERRSTTDGGHVSARLTL